MKRGIHLHRAAPDCFAFQPWSCYSSALTTARWARAGADRNGGSGDP